MGEATIPLVPVRNYNSRGWSRIEGNKTRNGGLKDWRERNGSTGPKKKRGPPSRWLGKRNFL